MKDEQEEDWWRFEAGRLMGAEKATEQEDNRLSAVNLPKLARDHMEMVQSLEVGLP